jgi:hypothetical protein
VPVFYVVIERLRERKAQPEHAPAPHHGAAEPAE